MIKQTVVVTRSCSAAHVAESFDLFQQFSGDVFSPFMNLYWSELAGTASGVAPRTALVRSVQEKEFPGFHTTVSLPVG